MDTNQIYTIVNEAAAQAMGAKAIAVIDAQSLIALGNTILTSNSNTEAFLNVLVQRIGRTIVAFRKYKNKMSDMVLNDFEYGAIVQKINIAMSDAEEDPAYGLTDGGTVDPWKVNLPKISQSLFVKRTPYMWTVTISRKLLKEAFLSESGMTSFIGYIFGTVRNAIEYSLENLGRIAITSMMSMVPSSGGRIISLLTEYNALLPEGTTPLTAATAMVDDGFLRYTVKRMAMLSDSFTDISKQWNDGTIERFTPLEDQKLKVYSGLQRALETVVQYSAFHENFVKLNNFQSVNYWQSERNPMAINVKRPSTGAALSTDNIVACLYDRNALGTYRMDEDIQTTPINARGLYYNTCYHESQLWFNDTSENFVYFALK